MLRLSVHSGRLDQATHYNRTDWIDIAYDHLAAMADYKLVRFEYGVGAMPPVYLRGYPRWSGTLWDLAARAIAITTCPNPDEPAETVHAVELSSKRRGAFASAVSVIIEHQPLIGEPGRQLAAMEIVQHKRRGIYRATVKEDTFAIQSTLPFQFNPKYLRPIDLVLRAASMRLTGNPEQMPPRPPLRLPVVVIEGGKPYVPIHRLSEPARTGFRRWLARNSEPPIAHPGAREGLAPETMYTKFLEAAV